MTETRTLDPRTIEDMRWSLREAMYEDAERVIRHLDLLQQCVRAGYDHFATCHLYQAKLCLKHLIRTQNDLVRLDHPSAPKLEGVDK